VKSSIFICTYSAIIGWLAVYLPILYLRLLYKKEQFIKQLYCSLIKTGHFEEIVVQKLQSDQFDQEVEELIDHKLDDLVMVFKRQIPMASTFLTGGLLIKLKASAKVEIVKMIPDIKAKLLLRVRRDMKSTHLFDQHADCINVKRIDRYCLIYASIGALIGFLLGLVQLAIMPLIS